MRIKLNTKKEYIINTISIYVLIQISSPHSLRRGKILVLNKSILSTFILISQYQNSFIITSNNTWIIEHLWKLQQTFGLSEIEARDQFPNFNFNITPSGLVTISITQFSLAKSNLVNPFADKGTPTNFSL